MKAIEARVMAKDSVVNELKQIYVAIDSVSKKGQLRISIPRPSQAAMDTLLFEDGYKLWVDLDSDKKELDTVTISWAQAKEFK